MVVLEGLGGDVIDQAVVQDPVAYPYVSGLLAFRETPPLVHAYSKLTKVPELVFVDGHGILHARGVGLASHLGILLDIPTIGCAKGPPLRKPGFGDLPRGKRGTYHPLLLTGDRPAGALLHTRDQQKPLYISPGHKITLEESIQWALRATRRYRIPEPIRRAHQLASRVRRERDEAIRC
jgi:deoxyribonuclease V